MKNRRILIMACSGFVFAVILGAYLVKRRVRPSCWTSGDQPLTYAVEMKESEVKDGPGKESKTSRLTGKIQFLPAAAPSLLDSSTALEGRFFPSQYQYGDDLYKEFRDFTYSFQVEIDDRCHVKSIDFDGRETFSARRTLQRLVRVLALGRQGEYIDFLGESQMQKNISEQDSAALSYTRVSILRPIKASNLDESVKLNSILSSHFEYQGPLRSLWYPKCTVSERLLLSVGSKNETKVLDYFIELVQLKEDLQPFKASVIAKPYRVRKSLAEDLRGRDRPSLYDVLKPNPPSLSLDQAIEAFRHDQARRNEAKAELIEYLRSHPEAMVKVRSLIEERTFTDEQLIHILFVLAKVGSAEAQEAIASLISNENLDAGTRLRSIFAAGELRIPGAEVINSVRNTYQSLINGAAKMDEMTSSALLSSGLLASNLHDIMPEEEGRLLADIRSIYKVTESPEIKANTLDAMGNTANEEFAQEIRDSSHSPSELERKAAYDALARVPLEGREVILVQAVRSDVNTKARFAAYQSLKTIGIDKQAVTTVKTAISHEPDGMNRIAGMEVLGRALAFHDDAKTALLDLIAKENDPAVLQAAGRYVSAYDILKAKHKP
ncbi:MAG: HEAT repeat domain-containing protein [Chitinophagaceae bacterium]|nr:HEAT repeat domain-containing protein [Oligoflexus sp.]